MKMSKQESNSDNPQKVGSMPRLVRPFEVGDWVAYRNHVAGYLVFSLEVAEISNGIVTAESVEGRTFTFHADTGMATWSGNLSISHWPNVESIHPESKPNDHE